MKLSKHPVFISFIFTLFFAQSICSPIDQERNIVLLT